MCAINGIAGGRGKEEEAVLLRMNEATKHRGPDGTRAFVDDDVLLGFNRLAIIDLSENAMQPMHDESGRYTIVFNGEIYNYRELRKELSEYPFKTQSDTEVILAAYSRWGEAAFSRLNGMFALAIFDSKERSLVLARDVVGIKPLYYHLDGSKLVFSSEIKGILAAGVARRLNREAFGHYLRLQYVPAPLTMFDGVQKLLPGNLLRYQNGSAEVRPYKGKWPHSVVPQSFEEARSMTRAIVEYAVERQLVSDRPVGVYLSGGIDSSVVAWSAAKIHPRINTFSVGFELQEGEEPEKFNADMVLARETSLVFNTTHHEFLLSSSDVLDYFGKTVRHLDEPIGNATAIAQLYLADKVKSTATVVLTGDGGDELFGGYERYRLAHVAKQYGGLIPGFVASRVSKLQHIHLDGAERFAQLMFQKDSEISRVIARGVLLPDTKKLFESEFVGGDIVANLMRADEEHWLVDEALMRSDKTSMGASIEARVPLLDLDVRALAHAVTTEYKVTPFTTKRVLKEAFADVLPRNVLQAPKRGWFSPGAKWLRHPNFVAHADRAFTEEYVPNVGEVINISEVRRMWEDHRAKRSYHYTTLYAVLAFLEWAKEYKVSL